MKRFIFALMVAVMLCGSAFGASSSEIKRMSTFLSNFTEQGMYNIDTAGITDAELIHFGIWHNYINNYKSRIADCPNGKKCPYGYKVIDRKYVAESVKKYFDTEIEHASIDDAHYDGRLYHFMPADGERIYYAEVQKVSQKGNVITMRGELYAVEDKDDRPATFTATAKPYKHNGRNTWSILTLATNWRGEM